MKPDAQQQILDDLLSEKKLSAIYQRSWQIKYSKFNLVFGMVVIAALCFLSWFCSKNATQIVDLAYTTSLLAFLRVVGLLGIF